MENLMGREKCIYLMVPTFKEVFIKARSNVRKGYQFTQMGLIIEELLKEMFAKAGANFITR